MRQLWRGFPVGQFQNAVQHAHCQRFAADRTDVAKGQRIPGFKHHVAGTVAVEVVLALVGVEFHCAEKAAVKAALVLPTGRGAQGRKHARIAGLPGKQICLAAQVGPGMRVRIGNKRVAVKPADKPVHGRVGRKAGLQGKNMFGKITIAVFKPVKARFGAKKRKPGRPHVGGNHHRTGCAFQHDFKQITRIKAQNGAAVGIEVADLRQTPRKALRILKGGHKHKIVNLAHLAAAFVDGADLGLQHEQGGRGCQQAGAAGCPHEFEVFRLHSQPVQAGGLVEHQLFAQLCPPLRVRKVARAQDIDALAAGPGSQMTRIEGLACGARKAGMYVQISYEVHGSPCGDAVWIF